jgi:hypothetical protein
VDRREPQKSFIYTLTVNGTITILNRFLKDRVKAYRRAGSTV